MKNELRGIIKQLKKNDGKIFSDDLLDYMDTKHGFVRYCRPDNNRGVWAFWKDIETIEGEFVTTKCVAFVGEMFEYRYDKLVTATLHVKQHTPWSRTVHIDDDFEVLWERGE